MWCRQSVGTISRERGGGSNVRKHWMFLLRAIPPPSPILPREVANLAYFDASPADLALNRTVRMWAPHWRALTNAAATAAIAITMNSPLSSSEEIFHRLLDESAALLAVPESPGIAIPDDELHREIIVPLLPAMLADTAIRGHWSEQAATGFVARIGRHFANGDPAPRWTPGDFEIHVTASFSAGADARALADTLLSEESLRDMTAALMNQLLDVLWPSLAPAPPTLPSEIPAKIESSVAEIPASEITPSVAQEIPVTEVAVPVAEEVSAMLEAIIASQTELEPALESASALPLGAGAQILQTADLPSAIEVERPLEIQTARWAPSRTLIRALCGKLAASAVQRGLLANSAPRAASAAIVARRILQRSTPPRKKKRLGSRSACLG